MAVNLKRPEKPQVIDAVPTTVAETPTTDIVPVEQYDIVADQSKMRTELANSPEVDAIASQMDIYDLDTIVSFGSEVATEIAKASDTVLNSMSMSQLDETSKLMVTLTKIMEKFDIDEIKDDPGFFQKIFNNAKKQLDKVLAKYNTMGAEVDKIYVELRKYEDEIKQSNKKLATMFNANVNFFHELEKYIIAGEESVAVIESAIAEKQAEFDRTQNNSIMFEVQTMQQAQQLLEQRVQDLRMAESVAMQSIPMIKTMEFSNYNLVRKINSAFIITLPVFKQALAQAILLKRQRIQAESMAALDQKTNEMLIKNAQNTVEASKLTAQLASGSSIKIETLESTWKTIMSGIDETKRIQDDAKKKREDDKARLAVLKAEFTDKYGQIKNPAK